jgi:signal transduction histidine kinase
MPKDRKADEALRGLKDNLEAEVKKKTKELTMAYKDLENAKRLADIGAVVVTVAHELRNPLGVIKAAVYNIKHKAKDESIASHLNNIDKKIAESDIIIKNLLSYSRVMVPQYKPVLIRDLITECVRNFKAKYNMSDVMVNMRCGCKKRDKIEADSTHLTSLFLNILDNSYQSFCGKKGVIDIESVYNRADNRLQIDFKDNGLGISKSDLDKLFEPFFTTKAKGIGLGLTVCKQIVSIHNGKIDITSKEFQGTTVSITLPISRK